MSDLALRSLCFLDKKMGISHFCHFFYTGTIFSSHQKQKLIFRQKKTRLKFLHQHCWGQIWGYLIEVWKSVKGWQKLYFVWRFFFLNLYPSLFSVFARLFVKSVSLSEMRGDRRWERSWRRVKVCCKLYLGSAIILQNCHFYIFCISAEQNCCKIAIF